MLNVFETPWLILGLSFVGLAAVAMFRQGCPDRCRGWHMLLPFVLAGAGFGVEMLVDTDLEKINFLMDTASEAVVEQDVVKLGSVIAASYTDIAHRSKDAFMGYCKRMLSMKLAEKVITVYATIDIKETTASAKCKYLLQLDPGSNYGIGAMSIEINLHFIKNGDNDWLIGSTEIVSINKQKMNWNSVSGRF